MNMKKLLFGTTNAAKLDEVRQAMRESGVEILGLKDFSGIRQVEEAGETFEENAVLKAKGYFAQTSTPTIADDGGLVIDALGGLPGVHSHRWLGHEATDQELVEAVLKRMEGIPQEDRTARLCGVMVFWDGTHLLKIENHIAGIIAEHLLDDIRPGFPYRPILFLPQFGKPYSRLTDEEHERVNFRRKNLHELKPHILELLKE